MLNKPQIVEAVLKELNQNHPDLACEGADLDDFHPAIQCGGFRVVLFAPSPKSIAFSPWHDTPVNKKAFGDRYGKNRRTFRQKQDGSYNYPAIAQYLADGFRVVLPWLAAQRDWYARFLATFAEAGVTLKARDIEARRGDEFYLVRQDVEVAAQGYPVLVLSGSKKPVQRLIPDWDTGSEEIPDEAEFFCLIHCNETEKLPSVDLQALDLVERYCNAACRTLDTQPVPDVRRQLLHISPWEDPVEAARMVLMVNQEVRALLDSLSDRLGEHEDAVDKSTALVAEINHQGKLGSVRPTTQADLVRVSCNFSVEVSKFSALDLLDKIREIERYCEEHGIEFKQGIHLGRI